MDPRADQKRGFGDLVLAVTQSRSGAISDHDPRRQLRWYRTPNVKNEDDGLVLDGVCE